MSDREFENYLTLIGRLLRLSPAQREAIGEELRDHFESRLAELVERGLAHDEAVRIAWKNSAMRPVWPPASPVFLKLAEGGSSCVAQSHPSRPSPPQSSSPWPSGRKITPGEWSPRRKHRTRRSELRRHRRRRKKKRPLRN